VVVIVTILATLAGGLYLTRKKVKGRKNNDGSIFSICNGIRNNNSERNLLYYSRQKKRKTFAGVRSYQFVHFCCRDVARYVFTGGNLWKKFWGCWGNGLPLWGEKK
jgi:DNA polymerase elongation subunit (family B)